jgi:hypothetical protein
MGQPCFATSRSQESPGSSIAWSRFYIYIQRNVVHVHGFRAHDLPTHHVLLFFTYPLRRAQPESCVLFEIYNVGLLLCRPTLRSIAQSRAKMILSKHESPCTSDAYDSEGFSHQ